MNQNFTQKSMDAIRLAQSAATERGHMQIEPVHILYALLSQEESLIAALLERMGIDVSSMIKACEGALSRVSSVSGPGRRSGEVYVSQGTERLMNDSAKLAKSMNDEYISVEHLFLALLDSRDYAVQDIFRNYAVDKDAFLKVLADVRGNTRVTSDTPEDTYEALKKYGQDLVEAARQHKLDPVIGRDAEIRNVIRILSRKTKNNRF